VLAGPVDEGRASYQVERTVCEHCQRAAQTAQGESLEIATEVAAMARCDGQQLASANSKNPHVGLSRDGDAAGRKRRRPLRANQDVPPAVRRQVLRRDRHRCQVPGCRHANFVDVHHLRTREDGGSQDAANLVTLCAAHHRACRRGELIVQGVSRAVSSSIMLTARATADPWPRPLPTCRCRHSARCEAWASVSEKRERPAARSGDGAPRSTATCERPKDAHVGAGDGEDLGQP